MLNWIYWIFIYFFHIVGFVIGFEKKLDEHFYIFDFIFFGFNFWERQQNGYPLKCYHVVIGVMQNLACLLESITDWVLESNRYA